MQQLGFDFDSKPQRDTRSHLDESRRLPCGCLPEYQLCAEAKRLDGLASQAYKDAERLLDGWKSHPRWILAAEWDAWTAAFDVYLKYLREYYAHFGADYGRRK